MLSIASVFFYQAGVWRPRSVAPSKLLHNCSSKKNIVSANFKSARRLRKLDRTSDLCDLRQVLASLDTCVLRFFEAVVFGWGPMVEERCRITIIKILGFYCCMTNLGFRLGQDAYFSYALK